MKLLIDADACPVVEICLEQARKRGIPVTLYCDTSHILRHEDAETVVVSKGADSADFALVNRAERGDVVVTQDFGLAAMCMARGAVPLDQNGRIYSDDNIGLLLEQRNIAKRLRRGGARLKGPKPRRDSQDAAFERTLRSLLSPTVM